MFELAQELMKCQRERNWQRYKQLATVYNSMVGFTCYDVNFKGDFEDRRIMPLRIKIEGRSIIQFNS